MKRALLKNETALLNKERAGSLSLSLSLSLSFSLDREGSLDKGGSP